MFPALLSKIELAFIQMEFKYLKKKRDLFGKQHFTQTYFYK